MIEAVGLSKRYSNGVEALRDLDLKVERGEVFCLLGANGAGKTTTLNLLLDFIRPTAGTASIAGVDVHQDPLRAKEHLAFMPERLVLYESLSARQHLDFFARLAEKPAPSREAGDALLHRVGLQEEVFDQKVRDFSKGMRQKLGIAVALIKDADAFILDEPLSGLDPDAAALFVDILIDLGHQGKAILMSTHDIFRAKELADRVGIMRNGRKVGEWTREELRQEDLEELYLRFIRQESARSTAS